MLESVTFLSVTVRNFRGFRDEQSINLDGSVVIVTGPNGTGKTSFFDAIQWMLLGKLPRLAALTTRRSVDHIVNRFGQGQPAYVSADLLLQGGPVRLTRIGNAKSTVLEWRGDDGELRGEEAEARLRATLLARSDVTLEDTLLSSGILQQDVLRLVLQDDPKKRYRHMAALLGLQELTGFEDVVKSRSETLKRNAATARDQHAAAVSQARKIETELQRLEERLGAQPELTALREELTAELGGSAFAELVLPRDLAGSTALGQTARQIRSRIDQLLEDSEQIAAEEGRTEIVNDSALGMLRTQTQRAEERLAQSEAAVTVAREAVIEAKQRSDQWVLMARHAIPLLGPSCPVCEQVISPGDVEEHLRQIIAGGGENLSGLEERLTLAELLAHSASAERNRLQDQLRQAEEDYQRAEAARAAKQDWLAACERLVVDTGALSTAVAASVRSGDASLLAKVRASSDVLAGVTDRLLAALSASTLGEQVERQRSALVQSQAHAEALRETAVVASRREHEAKTLWDATTKAASAVTRIRFEQLQPLVNDIFGRLDPHPVFIKLGFDLNVSYRSGVADPFVQDEDGISGDPLLIFSSSQANVAALTYFLAMSWTAEAHALPFLLLDDPLQSMDDVNILGFADLCRHIRTRRQLVVSTHEARLAGLLQRKLTPRDGVSALRVVRFVGWDRSGPKIEENVVEGESEVAYLIAD